MKNLPERIYLNLGDGLPADADFCDLSEVTWSQEPTTDNNVEYARPPQWISVDERLPEKTDQYLTIDKFNFARIDEFELDFGWVDYWDSKLITHWMPVPDCPCREKGGEK